MFCTTNLVINSRSAATDAAAFASNDIRYRLRSVGSAAEARFPVLRFLGRESCVPSLPRPRSSSPVWFSAPARVSWSAVGGGRALAAALGVDSAGRRDGHGREHGQGNAYHDPDVRHASVA